MKKILLFIVVFFLWTCSKDSKSPSEPEQPPIVVNLTSLNGQAQKGPFNNGTSINVAELSNILSPTGRNFSSSITDNTGRFAVANVQLESPYVELRANGYYFNEVKNEISSGQLNLYALSDLRGKTSLNVNIITHLEKNRIAILMSEPNSKTFAQAKLQAQEEILAIFDFSRANMPASELLDISQGGAANAKLLAISAIVQGNLTVGQMSELLANISTDLASDGVLNDANLKNTLIDNTKNLDLNAIRTNLANRYQSLGISATIADFESEINQFLKPPVVQDMSVSTEEDTPINITLAGSDPEGESLTYNILEVNNATLSLNGNVVTYTPNANYNGTDTFTYKANDGTSDSNTGTVTITVGAVDDDPNTQDIEVTTDEDVTIAFTLTAEEYDGQSYSFALRSQPTNGSVSLSGNTATYTPNENWNGQDSFTFEATDDRLIIGVRNVATATITVNSVNDAPIANDITNQVTNENRMMQLEITLDASDVEGDDLTYRIVSTNNGSVTINNNIATYVPTQDWNGEDTFTYVANDGSVDSNTATVTITVNSQPDAPITQNFSVETNEDFGLYGQIPLSDNSFDPDGDDLVYIVTSLPENGKLCQDAGAVCGTILAVGDIIKGENSVNSSTPVYEPNSNFNGTDYFQWKVNDGSFDSNISTVTIKVNPTNDPPIANDYNGFTRINVPLSFSLQGTDIDENENLEFFVENSPENGTIDTSDNINFIYRPNTGFIGIDYATFKAYDGDEYSTNAANLNITVLAGGAPVSFNSNHVITYSFDPKDDYAFEFSMNSTDPDFDPLTFIIDSQPDIGSARFEGSNLIYSIDKSYIDQQYETSLTWYSFDGAYESNYVTATFRVNLDLAGYISEVNEYDYDAYLSNFTSGLRTSDVSYLGQKNIGSTGFFIGNRAGMINVGGTARDFDRFDYWQYDYSVEINFNETSFAWSYPDNNALSFIPLSIYIHNNNTGKRYRAFVSYYDSDKSSSWSLFQNLEPEFQYQAYEPVYAYFRPDLEYDSSNDAQYILDNDLELSAGLGWQADNPGVPYEDGEKIYPFVTAILISQGNSSIAMSLIVPNAPNQSALSTGYTTSSSVFIKTDKTAGNLFNTSSKLIGIDNKFVNP